MCRKYSSFSLGWRVEDKNSSSMNVNFCPMGPGSIHYPLDSCWAASTGDQAPCLLWRHRDGAADPSRGAAGPSRGAAGSHAPPAAAPTAPRPPPHCVFPGQQVCLVKIHTPALPREACFLKASSPSRCRKGLCLKLIKS